jgi:hypothetical protein
LCCCVLNFAGRSAFAIIDFLATGLLRLSSLHSRALQP